MKRYDIVVVGSGAGGLPVATLLAERGRKVLLVEAGGPVTPKSASDAVQQYYLQSGLTVASGNGGFVSILAGEALGGTTAINSGTCLAPPEQVLAQWDQTLGTKLVRELPAHLETVKTDINVIVPPRSLLGPSHALFESGIRALGAGEPFVLPRNAKGCEGSGMCCFGCPKGAKQSTDKSYLPRAITAGTEVLTYTRVTRIKHEARGSRLMLKGREGTHEVWADKLVLAGGALGTPRLLRDSRLGNAWKGAGNHLTIHPAAKVIALFPHAVHGERGIPQGMGMTLPALPHIYVEGIFTPKEALLPVLLGVGTDVAFWLREHERVASFGLMVQDESAGSLRWAFGVPILRYALTRRDAYELVTGLKLIGQAYFRAGAERVLLPIMGAPNEFSRPSDLEALDATSVAPKRIVVSGFHPLGTAGMGRVVDGDLKLLGTDNVWISDGSVLPTPPGVNPQLTIMAFAHRLAARLAV